jgi:hypothetical protein
MYYIQPKFVTFWEKWINYSDQHIVKGATPVIHQPENIPSNHELDQFACDFTGRGGGEKRRQDAQDAWTGGKDDTSVDLEGMIYIL